MNKPLISVIVPVYNVESYLNRCVDSICKQTYQNIEIILVDDGSPDNCPAICDAYAAKDNRVKVIHKANGGLSSARNAGLDIAKGEYIGFVDSDDYIAEDMYEKLSAQILKHDADICFCRCTAVAETGECMENHRFFEIKEEGISGTDVLEILVKGGSTHYEVVCNKLYHRDLFAEIRFPEGRYHEDAFVTCRIYGSCSKIVFLEDALYYYFLRSDSIMRQAFSVKRLDVIDAFLERTRYCQCIGKPEIAALALMQTLGKTLEMWMQIPRGDYESEKYIRRKMSDVRRQYRTVPLDSLDFIQRIKLFIGIYFTPVYRAKLKYQLYAQKKMPIVAKHNAKRGI